MTTRFRDYLDRGWWMRLLSLFPCLIRIEIAIAPHHVGGVAPRLQYPFE